MNSFTFGRRNTKIMGRGDGRKERWGKRREVKRKCVISETPTLNAA
jgi:hypothetical protein